MDGMVEWWNGGIMELVNSVPLIQINYID